MDRRDALKRICEKYGVTSLYVFGSRADEVYSWLEGEPVELAAGLSDVDAGAKAAPGVQWSVDDKVHLALDLEDLFGCSRVDLVALDQANPFLAEEVIRGNRLYARDEVEADEYDLFVLRRAGDLAPLELEWMSDVLGMSL
jgi:predicted nucleotidyltransferase